VIRNIFLEEISNHEWCFVYPESAFEYDKNLDNAQDFANSGNIKEARRILLELIENSPTHIDSYHHLALLFYWENLIDIALQLWEIATNIGLACFPKKFRTGIDLLEYSILSNRPFLRAYHALGLAYLRRFSYELDILRHSNVERALSIFENIMMWNPNDNQGVRALAIECSFELKKADNVIKICEKFSNDILEEVIYGKALALLQVDRVDEAELALEDAIKRNRLIAEMLARKNYKNPKIIVDQFSESRSKEEEAYSYWHRNRKYWQQTKKAIDLIRRCLKKM
jgi:tetratricopeptide (TPR) repeat protein